MLSVVGTRYAKALAEVALKPGSGLEPKSVMEQLKRVEDLVASSPELRHVMFSPAVASSKKRGVIRRLADQLGLAKKVEHFLYVVINHRRVQQLPEIREALEAVLDAELGVARARITSAKSLSESQQGVLEAQLGRLTGKKVRAEYAVDDELIGGLVARVGSTVYDGSVRGQLQDLRRKLAAEG